MAQTASPSPDQSNPQTANPQLVPPDERFWQRYSPHAEFPLSSAGSLAIHILIFGLLGLMAWLGAVLFSHANRSLPVEAVRFDRGGGGGRQHGIGDAPNNGPEPVEAGTQNQENPAETASTQEQPKPKDIKLPTGSQLTPSFDTESIRRIKEMNAPNAKAFTQLSKAASAIRVPDRQPSGEGGGGTGSGGGAGDGRGKGVGNGEGAGHAKLTQREKRMLRWTMRFNTSSGENYVAQLQGLGAILAIPVREDANGRDYRIVRDLGARPATMKEEDLSKIQRIYWIDDKPQSVGDVLRILGIELPMVPSHFVAFMPEELEQKLFNLEKAYLEEHYRGRTEESIEETEFQINRLSSGKYEPKVKKLTLKKKGARKQ